MTWLKRHLRVPDELLVATLVAASVWLATGFNVSLNWKYGEFVAGLRYAPNVCADLILRGKPAFYAGLECDY